MLSFNFSPFLALETERLRLQQLTPGDAPALFALRSDPQVMQHISRPLAQSVDEAREWIQVGTDALQNNDGITWGIFTKEGSPLQGTIGFWRIQKEHHRAEIGYLLHPQCQGKGMMQEALAAMLHYGFSAMKLHSVEANVKPGNTASEKLLLRNGFVQEGYFRENYYFEGVFGDSAVYSLLAPKPAEAAGE